ATRLPPALHRSGGERPPSKAGRASRRRLRAPGRHAREGASYGANPAGCGLERRREGRLRVRRRGVQALPGDRGYKGARRPAEGPGYGVARLPSRAGGAGRLFVLAPAGGEGGVLARDRGRLPRPPAAV
ncbi:MAG: hypothetical protein AVDCRST_MAG01-01-166, partial [uncultured Rubrobacteraceae bacterium]